MRIRNVPRREQTRTETHELFGAFSRDARAIPRRETAASRNAAILKRTTDASTSERERRRVAAREGARQSAPALRARRHFTNHDPAARRRGKNFQPQYAPALAGESCGKAGSYNADGGDL